MPGFGIPREYCIWKSIDRAVNDGTKMYNQEMNNNNNNNNNNNGGRRRIVMKLRADYTASNGKMTTEQRFGRM